MTPEAYLQEKNWTYRYAPGELQTQCVFCGDRNKYGHLYVNREHGSFYCHRCNQSGSFYEFQILLGDKPEPIHKDLAQKHEVWSRVVEISQDALIQNTEALSYLKYERGFRAETIGKYRLGWVPRDLTDLLLKDWSLAEIRHAGLMNEDNYPLMWDRILIPYYQRDRIVTLRAKQIGGNIIGPRDVGIHLFGIDNLRGKNEVFLAEGEFDAIFMDQLGYPACGIPGALSFQEHWSHWFEGARRVYICLDADEAGVKGAYKTEALLGRRSRIVEFPVPEGKDTTDVTEFFRRDGHTKEDFDAIIDGIRGQRVFSLSQALSEHDKLMAQEGAKLGWPDLDWAMTPGLLPGQLMIPLARTGQGKTAWLAQVCHNLSSWQNYAKDEGGPGLPTLVCSMEQTKSEWAHRLERIGHLYNPWASREDLDQWYSMMRIVDENRIPFEDIPILIDEFLVETGSPPKLVIVDYLGYWARGFKGKDRYERVSEAVLSLKEIAKRHDVAIIAPHQVSREGRHSQAIDLHDARDSGVIEETGDFVFGLFRPKKDSEEDANVDYQSRADTRLSILKSRHGNAGRQVHMLWAPYSLAFVPKGSQYETKIRHEWYCHDLKSDYEDVLKIHRSGQSVSIMSS